MRYLATLRDHFGSCRFEKKRLEGPHVEHIPHKTSREGSEPMARPAGGRVGSPFTTLTGSFYISSSCGEVVF